MARTCQNCGRGTVIGHNVSPAKNRTKRFFRPNLQSLRALKNGATVHVVFCTRCIQRMKKYGSIGGYFKFQYATVVAPVTAQSVPSHKHIDRDAKKIEEIMKKEEEKWKAKETDEKTQEEKKKVEKIKLDELVGKK